MSETASRPLILTRIHRVRDRAFLFQVESSADREDYRKYEDLRNAIWDFPEDSLPGTRNMLCENFLHEGSCLYLAVYADDDGRLAASPRSCVGFAYGFVGLKDKRLGFRSLDNLWFYSQYTGVLESYRSYGLGVLLKEFQRDVLLGSFGVSTVVCTYDPLTAVNANRNVHNFGMEVLEYRPDVYGDFGGRLNRRDVPSDRFFMSWDLGKRAVRKGPSGERFRRPAARPLGVERREVRGRSGPVTLEVARESDPGARESEILVPIPGDFYSMLRETDVEDPEVRRIPLDWRLKTRDLFLTLFSEGYRVADFLRSAGGSHYLLRKQAKRPAQ
jgi:predicted GNAT superfamily acetyltransferase